MQDQVVTAMVIKGFAMTGWRFGHIGAPKTKQIYIKMQGQITSTTYSIAQKLQLQLFQKTRCTKQMCQTFKERRDLIIKLLSKIKV